MYQSQIKHFENLSYVDLYPLQLGRATCPPNHTYGPTSRLNYLFHYITQGRGQLTLVDSHQTFQLEAGQGFLIMPHIRASYMADTLNPWTYCWIEFNGVKAKSFLKQAGLHPYQPIFTSKSTSQLTHISQPLHAIIDHSTESETFVLSQIYTFFDALIQHSNQVNRPQDLPIYSNYLQNALNYIQVHFAENISLESIAAHLYINVYHLNRIFKQELGMTPHQYLLHYRLTHAKHLMLTQPLTLREIALQSGFANQYYFSTSFKRHFGKSPSLWLKDQPPHSNS